jgi:hypothetical protein
MIYVLDSKGAIRFKGVRDKKMDEAVDQLLAELEKERVRNRPISEDRICLQIQAWPVV